MTRLSTLALVLGVVACASAAGATENGTKPHRIHHPAAVQPVPVPAPAPQPWWSSLFKPYAQPGDGDNDGLSRDPDDCNKGCIGGNPG